MRIEGTTFGNHHVDETTCEHDLIMGGKQMKTQSKSVLASILAIAIAAATASAQQRQPHLRRRPMERPLGSKQPRK
jgi:hypothetical protein